MRTAWEYLEVVYIFWTEHAHPADNSPQTWHHELWVREPGAPERELREDSDLHALLNDLGAKGWEVISERNTHTTIVGTTLGWHHGPYVTFVVLLHALHGFCSAR